MKRKPDPIASGDNKRVRPSTPVDDELEDEGEPWISIIIIQYTYVLIRCG